MAAPEPSGRVVTLEGMRDTLNSKKSEIEAAHGRLGGKVVGEKGVTATSKMQAYRTGHRAMNLYNQTVRKTRTENRSPESISHSDPKICSQFPYSEICIRFRYMASLGAGVFRSTRHSMPRPEVTAFVSRNLH